MSRSTAMRRERMHLRLDAPAKRKLARAAAYSQKTTTDFVLGHALDAAERIIQEHERSVVLSDEDWGVFFDALLNPPKPSSALRTAFRRHRKLTS